MKTYEKRSLYTFLGILFIGFILMYTILSTLFFFKEEKRLSSESRMQQHIQFTECKNIFQNEKNCHQYLQSNKIEMSETYKQILYAFFIALLLITPLNIILGYLSLRPVRDATSLLDRVMEQISHDMNTPMSAIQINAQSIANKTDGLLQKKAQRIVASAKQIELMQGNIQALVLQEKRSCYRENIELNIYVEEAIDTLMSKYPDSKIVYKKKSLAIYADKTDIQRILINIVENSIKYNKDSQEILIEIYNNTLSILDKGIGIKDVSKVFNNHYRESTVNTGLGIGLAATYQLCQQNKCEIKIQSTLGEGTQVELTFQKIIHV